MPRRKVCKAKGRKAASPEDMAEGGGQVDHPNGTDGAGEEVPGSVTDGASDKDEISVTDGARDAVHTSETDGASEVSHTSVTDGGSEVSHTSVTDGASEASDTSVTDGTNETAQTRAMDVADEPHTTDGHLEDTGTEAMEPVTQESEQEHLGDDAGVAAEAEGDAGDVTVQDQKTSAEIDSETKTSETTSKTKGKEGKTAEVPAKKEHKYPIQLGRFFLPTADEQERERRQYYDARTVAMGPATLMDLSNEGLFEHVQRSQSFSLTFHKEADGESFKGCLELEFKSVDEAKQSEESLEALHIREGLEIQHLYPKMGEDTDDIRKHGDPYACTEVGERTMAIAGLTDDISEETIAEHFPKAVNVFIPRARGTNKRKCHCYVEFANQEDLLEKVGTPIKVGERHLKTFVIEHNLPPDELLRQIDQENFQTRPKDGDLWYSETCLERPHVRAVALDRWSLFTGPLSPGQAELYKSYMRFAYHYLDSDLIDERLRSQLKKRIKMIRNHVVKARYKERLLEKSKAAEEASGEEKRAQKRPAKEHDRSAHQDSKKSRRASGGSSNMNETAVELLKGIKSMLQQGEVGMGNIGGLSENLDSLAGNLGVPVGTHRPGARFPNPNIRPPGAFSTPHTMGGHMGGRGSFPVGGNFPRAGNFRGMGIQRGGGFHGMGSMPAPGAMAGGMNIQGRFPGNMRGHPAGNQARGILGDFKRTMGGGFVNRGGSFGGLGGNFGGRGGNFAGRGGNFGGRGGQFLGRGGSFDRGRGGARW